VRELALRPPGNLAHKAKVPTPALIFEGAMWFAQTVTPSDPSSVRGFSVREGARFYGSSSTSEVYDQAEIFEEW
jgi:hypothetical protein